MPPILVAVLGRGAGFYERVVGTQKILPTAAGVITVAAKDEKSLHCSVSI